MPDDLGSVEKEVQRRLYRRSQAKIISESSDNERVIEGLLIEIDRLKAKVEELQFKLKPIPHIH